MLDPTYRKFRQRDIYWRNETENKKEKFIRSTMAWNGNHKKKRSREEMIADILKVSRNHAATKTKIMRTCYTSYNQIQKYLRYAIENGLLSIESRSNRYYLTRKGMQYISCFEDCISTEKELELKKKAVKEILRNKR